jgi:hypothetical protein
MSNETTKLMSENDEENDEAGKRIAKNETISLRNFRKPASVAPSNVIKPSRKTLTLCLFVGIVLIVSSIIVNNTVNILSKNSTETDEKTLTDKVFTELDDEEQEFGGDQIVNELENSILVESTKVPDDENMVSDNANSVGDVVVEDVVVEKEQSEESVPEMTQVQPVEELVANITNNANHMIFENNVALPHTGDADIDHLIEVSPHTNVTDEQSLTLNYYANVCRANRAKNLTKGTIEYEIAAADCGWKYDYLNSIAKKKKWRVYFYGEGFGNDIMELSGCPTHCPLSPKCEMRRTKLSHDVVDGDVVVIFQVDAHALVRKVKRTVNAAQKQYKVLYWREAQYRSPEEHTQKLFDFEMGVHYYSGLLNPNFLRKPSQLLSGALYPNPPLVFIPFARRKGKFALSIISHCGATSQRENYISHMMDVLGAERIHKYGRCGDRNMPGKSINMAAKLMSQYKFYLAFENTVEDGYITEKLFFALNVPVVPVYLGALNVPNVTVTPSFIKASDYKSPRELSSYLLYLDSNEKEYMKYHSWRKSPSSFTQEYLDSLAYKVAGPEELLAYRSLFKRYPRTAQCCRLCDENYVKYATSTKGPKSLVGAILSGDAIQRRFFGKSGHL